MTFLRGLRLSESFGLYNTEAIHTVEVYNSNIFLRLLLTRTYILSQTKQMAKYILIYIKIDLHQEILLLHLFGRNLYGFLITVS